MFQFLQAHLQLIIPIGTYLLLGLINVLIGHKSQIDAWAEANPKRAAWIKLSRALGFDFWMVLQAVSLRLKGQLPPGIGGGSSGGAAPPPIGHGQGPTHVDGQILQFRRYSRRRSWPPMPAAVLVLALLSTTTACDKTFRWPDYAKCAPAPIEVLGDVEKAIELDGDAPLSDEAIGVLEQLGKKYGPGIVVCDVDQLLRDLSATSSAERVSAAPANEATVARAREFLSYAKTKVSR